MAYPIRFIEADQPYFVTARTIQGRFLLRPGTLVNELIGAILARGVRLYRVQLFDFVFTSNHFHLIVAATTPKKFAGFMQFLLSNIAVKVGRFVNWRARFWDRRYSCEPILDTDAFLERVSYIKAHGVKEKLVARVEDWPGLTTQPELVEGEVRSFPWRSWTKLWREFKQGIRQTLGRNERYSLEGAEEMETLVLTPYPAWSHMTPEQRRGESVKIIQAVNDEYNWTKDPTGRLVKRVYGQPPLTRPKVSKHSKRPKCHASSLQRWNAYILQHRALVEAYRDAAKRWLAGDWSSTLPMGCLFPAGWTAPQESR